MRPSPHRVAHRHLTSSAIDPPPAMVDAIYEWAHAVHAAGMLEKAERDLKQSRRVNKEWEGHYADIRKALEGFRREPTKWKLYKAAHEAALMWLGYGIGSKRKIRDFQKLDDARRRDLETSNLRWIEHVEDYIRGLEQAAAHGIREAQAKIRELKSQTRPGVSVMPPSGDLVRKFPLDTTGWRYQGTLLKRIQEQRDEQATQLRDKLDASDDAKDILRALIRDLESTNRFITVRLTRGAKGAANWSEAKRTISVNMPPQRDLMLMLKHELRHFAQGVMNEAVYGWSMHNQGNRKPGPGRPSRHIMTPDVTQHQDKTPDRLLQMLKERLESERTPSHIQRAILRRPKIDLHALDDVEFYTRLADAITDFEDAARRAPAMTSGQKRDMVKLFTGLLEHPSAGSRFDQERAAELGGYDLVRNFPPHGFFTTLKRYAKGKWKKAVGELVKIAL